MKTRFLVLLLLLGGVELPAQTIVQELFSVGGPSHVSDMDLPAPTSPGSVLIAMPGPLSSGVRVLSITDNAPGGSNTYKQITGAASSCGGKASLDIWYCENCRPGVREIKYHFSGHVASINTFLEVSQLALSSVVDGSGVQVSDGAGTSAGLVGPSITTTSTDFIIARYFSSDPPPTGVAPAAWKYKTTYVYALNAPSGTHQPTLTGGGAADSFCLSMAAFKTARSAAMAQPDTGPSKSILVSDNEPPGK